MERSRDDARAALAARQLDNAAGSLPGQGLADPSKLCWGTQAAWRPQATGDGSA
jgi:hypothetical protein